jgi:hypothetical protein
MPTLMLLAALLTAQALGHGNHLGWYKNGRYTPPVQQAIGPTPSGPTPSSSQSPSDDENLRLELR